PGQIEAARALGLPGWRTWVQIVFPQALPIFTPTYLSNATLVLKGTSVASIITIPELTSVANEIVSMTYQPFEILIAAALIYILMGGVLSLAAQAVRWNMTRRLASSAKEVGA
ncbi:ABC transporter permease subunit, partial [Sinorhizobium medicae]